MAIGDVSAVTVGDAEGIYCLDVGLFDVPEYGAVYLIDAERPAVIDTGAGANYGRILDGLESVGIDPDALSVIAPTHVHLDHAGGAGYLARDCPDAEVAIHRIGAPHLIDPERLIEGTKRAVRDQWELYAEPVAVPEGRVRELEGGDALDLGDRTLEVHHAPGHAPHQVVFHEPDAGIVFTADAAGIYVPERDAVRPTTPPPNFDLDRSLEDVEAIRDLDPAGLCYGHFGPAPTGDRLSRYETVLREWVERIERAREVHDDVEAIVERVLERDDVAAVWGERQARSDASVNVRGVLRWLGDG